MKIYKVVNSINGKVYVGQTTQSISARWRAHCSLRGRCRAIESAIKKYGIEAFSIEEIDTAETQLELDALERSWIDKLNTIAPNGYNLRFGGGGGKMHDDTKVIMSVLAKRPHRMVQFEEMRNDPKVRVKMAEGLKARWADSDYKKKAGAAIRHALNKPDVKAKRSAASRASHARPEYKKKYELSMAEVRKRPEFREKLSASMSKAWNEPGAREQRGDAIRAAKSTPEFKARYAATNALPEVKARRSAASTGRIVSAETRLKKSLAATGKKRGPYGECKPRPAMAEKWADPVWKAAVLEKRRASNADPVIRARRSVATTQMWESTEGKKRGAAISAGIARARATLG